MNDAIIITDSGRKTTPFTPPQRLDALLTAAGMLLPMPCGGRGVCGKCRVIASGALESPDDEERALIGSALTDGVRLACRAIAVGDVQIRVPSATNDRIQTQGEGALCADDPWSDGLCVAIDIGTTTVAAYCYHADTGERTACAAAPNPQAAFGADVISRMEKAEAGQADALRTAIEDCLRTLIMRLCPPQHVHAAVITGNTAMLTLLTGESPSPLLRAPFHMVQPFGIFIDPKPFGLSASAKVFLPRCISAYVGADITCALLASGLFAGGLPRQGEPVLLADIGTNGEIVLSADGRLIACSTAAGPAFEGAGISMGMTAQDGAIDSVDVVQGEIRAHVLGGGTARGICGSGLIDAFAALLDTGKMDETGRLLDGSFRFPGTDVVLTQEDARKVQLAKAAICAGMQTLLSHAGVDESKLERLLIAGGFGTHINPRSAGRIGLIPPSFAAKARAIGNAAGMGASMMALSRAVLKDADAASHACTTVELAANPVFMEYYMDAMLFGE